MNTTATNKANKAAKVAKAAINIFLGAMGAICLYAVLFMHRPDHLLTAAGYALMIYCINHKEEGEE